MILVEAFESIVKIYRGRQGLSEFKSYINIPTYCLVGIINIDLLVVGSGKNESQTQAQTDRT